MQSPSSDFLSVASANTRNPIYRLMFAWTKESTAGEYFTVGGATPSHIGGADIIKGSDNIISQWNSYYYFDESDNVLNITVDAELVEPIFSVAKTTLDVVLSNNDHRYDPDSTLGPDIVSQRPAKLFFGFEFKNTSELLQNFVGEIADFPIRDTVQNTLTLHCIDFADYLWNLPVVATATYENVTADEVISDFLIGLGLTTDQMDLDVGTVTIPLVFFKDNDTIGSVIERLMEAEQGRFFMDETGILRFQNRYNWTLKKTTSVFIIEDDIVITEEAPTVDSIVNRVNVIANPRAVQGNQIISEFSPGQYVLVPAGGSVDVWVNYNDPCSTITLPVGAGGTSSFTGNSASDGSGSDQTGNLDLSWTNFSTTSKGIFSNSTEDDIYLTALTVYGHPATVISQISISYSDDTSIAVYNEHSYNIDNDYIQTYQDGYRLAGNIVNDCSTPNDYKRLTIIAQPQLQLGDRITRSGSDYFIVRIKTHFTPNDGMTQELTVVNKGLKLWQQSSAVEKFLATTHKDAATTANWDIGLNKAYLGEASYIDYYDPESGGTATALGGSVTNSEVGQSFHNTTAQVLKRANFVLAKNSTPTGTCYAVLYAHTGTFGSTGKPTGAVLATSGTVSVSTLPTWSNYEAMYSVDFIFTDNYTLQANTDYVIALHYSGGDGTKYILVGYDTSSPAAAGNYSQLSNSTGLWTDISTIDLCFFVIGDTYVTSENLAQSTGYDTGHPIVSYLAPTISETLNSQTITLSYSDSDDNITFGSWVSDITTLSKRYIRWRAEMTGTVYITPTLNSVKINYLV